MGVKRFLKWSANKGFKRIGKNAINIFIQGENQKKMANISDANDYEKQKQKKKCFKKFQRSEYIN